ncbi:MAG: class I SAM-dependent methyltransferase [Pseudomonadota bacterium]
MTDQLRNNAGGGPPWLHHGPRAIHTHITRPVVQQLAKAEAHRVLDLGCGNGWFTGALDSCGFEVTGVDHDEASVRFAREQHPGLRFRQVDAMGPLDPGLMRRFDAVVAIDVIDHVPLPRRLVEAALAMLKPGGLLVITSPFHGYSKNLALALAGRFDSRWESTLDHGRMKFFSRSTLTALLSEFELRELHFEAVGRIPIFARSMLISAHAPA